MKRNPIYLLVTALLLSSAGGNVFAAKLQPTVGKAVMTNPDVLAKWHAFEASKHESDVGRGPAYPKVDASLSSMRQSIDPTQAGGVEDYKTDVGKISLQQNLFNGFGTYNDVKRLDHASRVRYFEFLEASESIGLNAAKAYINLYRTKKHLEFAEENYIMHRAAFEKLKLRNKAGRAPLVDLEMAGARLSVAESELVLRSAGLHDAKAVYQGVIGELPDNDIDAPPSALAKALPKTREEAVIAGFATSPQLMAAVESILSSQRNVTVERSGMYPRVDFIAESSRETNPLGVSGTKTLSTIGLQLNYNLFQGGKNTHRIQSAVEATSRAKDDRETVCRNLRQNLAVAYNENTRLAEKLPLLDQHLLSADKSREAFRKQFDIGQRTLLDVLDMENEYYKARGAMLDAEIDQSLAQARYLAGAGVLLKTIKVNPLEAEAPEVNTDLDEDAKNHCPPEAVPDWKPEKKSGSYVALLENADGTTGKVIVQGAASSQTIDQARFGAPLDGSAAPAAISEDKLKSDFGAAMQAQPPLPTKYVLYFNRNSTVLDAASKASLPKIVESIASRPAVEIRVTGHGDTIGDHKVNDVISKKRADVVVKLLKERNVKFQSLEVEGRGKRELLVQTPDKTDEPRNRAVRILVR